MKHYKPTLTIDNIINELTQLVVSSYHLGLINKKAMFDYHKQIDETMSYDNGIVKKFEVIYNSLKQYEKNLK